MKNLKVGKKFLLAFGLILAMFLIAVVSAGVGIRRSKASYRRFYEQEYEKNSCWRSWSPTRRRQNGWCRV